MARYAEPIDLFQRQDIDVLNDLANDHGSRESRQDLATNNRLLVCLDDASGEIDAALRVGGRYATSDLESLTGNSQNHLKRITCDIATSLLLSRRPGVHANLAEQIHETATKWLDQLRKGTAIFDLAAAVTAGNPSIDGPTSVDYTRMNLIPDRARRYFPSRSSRLPTDRG